MSAIRVLRQLTSLSTRTLASRIGAVSSRTPLAFRHTPLLTGVRTFSATPCAFNKDERMFAFFRSFHLLIPMPVFLAAGLSYRLQEELKYEETAKYPKPEALEEFKKLGLWEVRAIPKCPRYACRLFFRFMILLGMRRSL
jgi:hypothetical protein